MKPEKKTNTVSKLVDMVWNAPDVEDWDYEYVVPPEILQAAKLIPPDIQEEVAKEFFTKVSNPKANKFYRDNIRIQLKILEDIVNKTIDKYYSPISSFVLTEKEIQYGLDICFEGNLYTYRGKTSYLKFDNNNYMETAYHLEARNSFGSTQPTVRIIRSTDLISRAFKKKYK